MKKSVVFLLLILSAGIAPVSGTIRHVPGGYASIQAALNACSAGDTVLVQPGTYTENINWPSNAVSVKLTGAGGSATTVISGGNAGRVLNISSVNVDTNTVITGFTLTNGYINLGSGYGAGIYVSNSSPRFEDVHVTGNRVFLPGGHGYGAGIHLSNSDAVFWNCRITSNSIDSATWCYGGGAYVSGGHPRFTGVEISNNSARAENWCYGVGLYARNGADIHLENVKVTGNLSGDNAIWYYGYGIYNDESTLAMFNVLVASNTAGAGGSFNYGGGIFCDGTLGYVSMMNCTVAGNTKTGGSAVNGTGLYARDGSILAVNSIIYNPGTGSEIASSAPNLVSALYSDVRGGWGGIGNINAVPAFAAPGDYHLLPASPCAGTATDNGATAFDLDGVARPLPLLTLPDMGCYEVDQSATALTGSIITAIAFSVYPNPVRTGDRITVENASGYILISDVSGRLVYREDAVTGVVALSTAGWRAGVYTVRTEGMPAQKICITD